MNGGSIASFHMIGGLLAERRATIIRHSLEHQYERCKQTGRLEALDLVWTADNGKPRPHPFWDSDIGKWIESVSYALMSGRDESMEAKIDAAVESIARSQRADGYFNSFFQTVEPDRVFTNLRERHELYCLGHLLEGAVAYFRATGKRRLLDVLTRYVDLVDQVFGPNDG
jgi:uncharacterized protein